MGNLLQKNISKIAGFELWVVAGAVAASMLFERLLLPAVIVMGILFTIRLLSKTGFNRTPADWGIVGLIVMIPVTLWATALPDKTIPQVLRLLAGIGFYYALVNGLTTQSQLRYSGMAISVLGIFLALAGLVNTDWIVDKLPLIPGSLYSRLPTILADTIHPNVLAGFLAILIPIILSILLFSWSKLSRLERSLYSCAFLLIALVILLTQSRGGISALLVVTAVLAALRWKYGWAFMVAIVLVAMIGLATLGTTAFFDQTDIAGDSAQKLEGRIEIWSRGVYMLQDFPITGTGMGLFEDIADTLYPFFLNSPGSVPHAHNLFLQIAVDLGLPGLISWLAIFAIVLYTSWQMTRNPDQGQWVAGLGAGIFCSQMGLAVHGMTDSVSWGMVKLAPLVWGLWGLAMATWTIYKQAHLNATHC